MKVGNLEPVRDLLDVRDVVAAYLALLARGAPGEVYNIAGGEGHSLDELFARLAKQGLAPDKKLTGLSGLGWSQFKAGQLEEAAATFGQVLDKRPGPALAAETALARGQVLEKLKRSDGALAMYDLVISRYAASKAALANSPGGRGHALPGVGSSGARASTSQTSPSTATRASA